jgi:hypothetical protein
MSLVPSACESESIRALPATSAAAASCREVSAKCRTAESGSILPVQSWFADIVRKLWPARQRAKMLCFFTGVRSDRTARAWASGDYEPSASVLGALLRSDEGGRVLNAIMAGSHATWWLQHRRDQIMASAFEQARMQVQQQLEFALD